MAFEILLPKIGFSMNEAVFSEWLAVDGATVKEGDPLYAIESDKSTQEIESPASGVLHVTAEAGTTYQVGDVLGTIE
ncbi:MAG: dihydrolipoamide acyltransferase [Sphingomonadales bacterium]|nr:dihydrolipoamide acyltransferase [Sphingomonadales bacterium]